MSNRALWYVIQTYYNAENKVKKRIEYLINTQQYPGLILQVEIPTTKNTINQAGKIKQVEQKLFPGYVFLKVVLIDNIRNAIRSIPGVVGFVGPGGEPVPLSTVETVKAGLKGHSNIFKESQNVIITDGPFENFTGRVTKKEDKGVKVSLNIFGREVEITFSPEQLESLEGE